MKLKSVFMTYLKIHRKNNCYVTLNMHVIKIYKLYMKIKILVLRFTMRGAIPPFHQYVFMVWYLGKHRDIFNNLTKFNETQVTVYRCTRVYTKVSGLSHNEGLWRQNSLD